MLDAGSGMADAAVGAALVAERSTGGRGDRTHAALEWFDAMRASAGVITRSRLGEPTRPWKLVSVAPWYGQQAQRVHIAFATTVWWHSGLPAVLIRRWLLIRDLAGTFTPQALLATKPDLDPR
jgi:hypothetical protein